MKVTLVTFLLDTKYETFANKREGNETLIQDHF